MKSGEWLGDSVHVDTMRFLEPLRSKIYLNVLFDVDQVVVLKLNSGV